VNYTVFIHLFIIIPLRLIEAEATMEAEASTSSDGVDQPSTLPSTSATPSELPTEETEADAYYFESDHVALKGKPHKNADVNRQVP
jgi:hypothetical protein